MGEKLSEDDGRKSHQKVMAHGGQRMKAEVDMRVTDSNTETDRLNMFSSKRL